MYSSFDCVRFYYTWRFPILTYFKEIRNPNFPSPENVRITTCNYRRGAVLKKNKFCRESNGTHSPGGGGHQHHQYLIFSIYLRPNIVGMRNRQSTADDSWQPPTPTLPYPPPAPKSWHHSSTFAQFPQSTQVLL